LQWHRNTFDGIKEHDLKPPVVDVLDALARRLNRFLLPGENFRRGQAWLQDVTSPIAYPKDAPKAKLVFTSPPYLQVISYGKFNWVRHWLLQSDPREVDEGLFASASLDKYLSFISQMVRNVRAVPRDDGYFCMVVGDVRQGDDELNLARDRENVLRGHRSAGPDNHQRFSAGAAQGQSYLGRNTRACYTCGPNYHRARGPKANRFQLLSESGGRSEILRCDG
jgi:hypothetical protein